MAPNFLSITWCGEAFHRLGVQGVESLILVGALFLFDGRRRKEGKKKGEKKIAVGKRFSMGLDPTCRLCNRLQLICGSVFQLFPASSLIAVIILSRSSQNYSSVAPMSQGSFRFTELRLSASVP
jgi:hypothetical protein